MRRLFSCEIRKLEGGRLESPAGAALAVDREKFPTETTRAIETEPLIEIIRDEAPSIPSEGTVIVATGPLVSPGMSASIADFTGKEYLCFFDAISISPNGGGGGSRKLSEASLETATARDFSRQGQG